MLYLAIGLFALAAIIGVIILKNWLTSAETSRTVIYTHGIFAVLALVLLVVLVVREPSSALQIALASFGVAALGGIYMFLRDLQGKFSPTWLAIVHGLLAVVGFAYLVLLVI